MPGLEAARLRALADPTRIRLGMLLIEEAHTVKELAAALGVPPTRLYYHVRILEKHGLIEVVERRIVSGIEERRYKAVVENWQGAEDLSAGTIAKSGALRALFRAVNAELEVSLSEQPDSRLEDANSPAAILTLTEFMLTDEELADLRGRLEQMILEFGPGDRPARAGAKAYHFLLAGYRRPGATSAP